MKSSWLVMALLGIVVLWIGAYFAWGYAVSGRHRAQRQKLQQKVIELLKETGHATTFLLIVERDARAIEVRLPAREEQLQVFREILAKRLDQEFLGVRLAVVPLTESLARLRGAVAVWGHPYGQVCIGRGGVENAA